MHKKSCEYIKSNLELKENILENTSKEALHEYMDKILELRIKFKKEIKSADIPQENWLKFIKENNLEYEDLHSKGFFQPLPASDLLSWLIKQVNKKYTADTQQSAAPIRKILVVGIGHPLTVETLYGLSQPGERKLFTHKDNPDIFNRILATHYGHQALSIMYKNTELVKSQQIHAIELFRTPSDEPCLIFHIDPSYASPSQGA